MSFMVQTFDFTPMQDYEVVQEVMGDTVKIQPTLVIGEMNCLLNFNKSNLFLQSVENIPTELEDN